MYNTAKEFILDNWDKVIRENKQDNDTLIGLPYPYTVPCIGGMFQEMYYWDTYFTNVGLILSGLTEQAKNNVDNMCYLISKYGFMPNGNRTHYLSRSQPPFLSIMVMEVFAETGDKTWLAEKYEVLKNEYQFWQTKRQTENGLARYFGSTDDYQYRLRFGRYLYDRFGIEKPTDEAILNDACDCMYSFAESGWDCTTRFGMRAQHFNAVDLNCLLFSLENNMAKIAEILGEDGAEYRVAANKRKELIDKFLWNEVEGTYFDYDYDEKKQNHIHSTAAFYALMCETATKDEAEKIKATLPKLEQEYGLTCTEELTDGYDLQWDYPNGWACQQFVAIKGLLNYGFKEDALRLAEKYVKVVDKNFSTTNNLWEKYNVVTGEVSTAKEYKSPAMMGWSAGVYLYCLNLSGEVKTADITYSVLNTDKEVKGKALVHHTSWQETYKGLIDDGYLKSFTLEKCELIAARFRENTFIAKCGDKVVGFVGYGACRDSDLTDCGEIQGIYLLQEYQGRKIGYTLCKMAVDAMSDYSEIALWVLKGNDKAIRFYQRFGFKFDGAEKNMTPGTPVTERRMVYNR